MTYLYIWGSSCPWEIFKYVNGKIQYEAIVLEMSPIVYFTYSHTLYLSFAYTFLEFHDWFKVFEFPLFTVSSMAPLTHDFLESTLTISNGTLPVPLPGSSFSFTSRQFLQPRGSRKGSAPEIREHLAISKYSPKCSTWINTDCLSTQHVLF